MTLLVCHRNWLHLLWLTRFGIRIFWTALERLFLQNDERFLHNPIRHEQPDYEGRLSYTRLLYSDVYHSAPPLDIWGAPLYDIGTALEGERIKIEVRFGLNDLIRIVINKNTPVRTVLKTYLEAFNSPKNIHLHGLIFDYARMNFSR